MFLGDIMNLYIGSDHKGYPLEKEIVRILKKEGIDTIESTIPHSPEDDYPDFALDVAKHVLNDKGSLGIILCGNGIGVSIASNKVKGIYCARVSSVEDAHHAKAHNGCNMIAMGGLDINLAVEIIKTFIQTENPTEERHLRRIAKVHKIEDETYYEL